jgi:hypothetical protein
VPTGEHLVQGGVKGGHMDRFRHKSRRLGRGLEALNGRCICMGAHIDDRDRRSGLNVPRGVNAIHRPVQMDVHKHDVRAKGEGMFNRLRTIIGLGNDLIPEATELPSHV